MVKKNSVAGIHAICLPVVHRDPVCVELGYPVGAARVEWSSFPLGDFLHQAVELRGGGLVNTGFVCQAADAHRFKDAQGA